jgi:hypothetical protein
MGAKHEKSYANLTNRLKIESTGEKLDKIDVIVYAAENIFESVDRTEKNVRSIQETLDELQLYKKHIENLTNYIIEERIARAIREKDKKFKLNKLLKRFGLN